VAFALYYGWFIRVKPVAKSTAKLGDT